MLTSSPFQRVVMLATARIKRELRPIIAKYRQRYHNEMIVAVDPQHSAMRCELGRSSRRPQRATADLYDGRLGKGWVLSGRLNPLVQTGRCAKATVRFERPM